MIARRVVIISVAVLAVSVAAATIVGFWLSYAGLHDFALRNSLSGAEAWAWPASVDLFVIAGELGITISAVRHKKDPAAWVYLALGFGETVAFNILHAVPVMPYGCRYVVAAVPPIAAMLALAALMRQVYRLAIDADRPEPPGIDLARLAAQYTAATSPAPPSLPVRNGAAQVDPDATVTFDAIRGEDLGDAPIRRQ